MSRGGGCADLVMVACGNECCLFLFSMVMRKNVNEIKNKGAILQLNGAFWWNICLLIAKLS